MSLPDTSVDGCPQFTVILGLFLVPWDEFALIPSDYEKRYYVLTKVLHSSSSFFVFMTSVGFVHIYRWCRWGSVKTPPHTTIVVEDVSWDVLL